MGKRAGEESWGIFSYAEGVEERGEVVLRRGGEGERH